MQALVVDFRIKPEFVRQFAAEIEDNARLSRETEPGCRRFDVCRDPADAALFLLHARYGEDAAIQAHLQSAHFLEMDRRSAAWVHGKQARRLQRAAP